MRGDPFLDTNAAIAWLADDGGLFHRYMGRVPMLSIVTVGELRFGASNSTQKAENHRRVEEFINATTIVTLDDKVAFRYGELKAFLRRAGRPIPDNDLWIAATAIEHGLVLVTRDRHFGVVAGLAITGW